MPIKSSVDITPHPRILQVLGEIEFKPWQCLAELVDNSIDQFLKMERAGTPIPDPAVQVAFGRDTVVVKDNGPGMSLDSLELAVKAGWTSNERFGSLGLYGIGFNIATARLGSLTTIWTTQAGEDAWYGIDLDLKRIAKGGTYIIEVRTRTKSDPGTSGTEIEVSGIKRDWRNDFANGNWIRTNIIDRLSSIYATMLREENAYPIRFSLYVNGRKIAPFVHCVWPSDWTVYRKSEGLVRPIQEVNVTFGTRYVSRSTGEIFDSPEEIDEGDLIEVPERVYGWLGIQRYADEKEFGIDILRNGRKIEVLSKDVFLWDDDDGGAESEYPIDDPRYRGRIVGEVHLDHGYVHYTKHRFEREHSSWKQLLLAVRANEPLTKRERRGYDGVNTSHLGLLFRAFRRNSPGSGQSWQDILFIKDNEQAKVWAQKYRRGISPYTDDAFWRGELEKADALPKKEDDSNDGPSEGGEESSGSYIILGGDGVTKVAEKPQGEPEPIKSLRPDLSFRVTGLGGSGVTYDIETFSVEPNGSKAPPPWMSRATPRGVYEIEIFPAHSVFKTTTLGLRDAVLMETAHIIASEESARSGAGSALPLSEVIVALRARYAPDDSLDPAALRSQVEELRKRFAAALAARTSELERKAIVEELPTEEARRIELAYAQGPEDATLTDYLDIRQIARQIERDPEPFFTSGFLDKAWEPARLAGNSTLLTAYRGRMVRELVLPLYELGEFMDPLAPEPSRTQLELARACVLRVREYLSR